MNTSQKFFPFQEDLNHIAAEDESSQVFYEKSLSEYESGNYAAAITNLFLYLDKDILSHADNKSDGDKLSLTLEHGSVRAKFIIEEGRYKIESPFLKVPEGGKGIALLRKAAELNMSDLNLAQVKINKNNELYFYYSNSITSSHPDKLLSLLREICYAADYYDDLLSEQYGAEIIADLSVEPLEASDISTRYEIYKDSLSQAQDYLSYFKKQNLLPTAFDAGLIMINQIKSCVSPQGFVRSKLSRMYNDTRQRKPLDRLLSDMEKHIKELLEVDQSQFSESMYKAKFLLPFKSNIEDEDMAARLKNHDDMFGPIVYFRQNKNYKGAAMIQLNQIYSTIANYVLSKPLLDHLKSILAEASEKPWKEASDILLKGTDDAIAVLQGKAAAAAAEDAFDQVDFSKQYEQAMQMMKSAMDALKK